MLRHEREAHGLHGHGHRPHVCLYDGCDRADPTNGFPRKWNLLDHMKRVHDHPDDATDARPPSPMSEGRISKGGRRRRASTASQGSNPKNASKRAHAAKRRSSVQKGSPALAKALEHYVPEYVGQALPQATMDLQHYADFAQPSTVRPEQLIIRTR